MFPRPLSSVLALLFSATLVSANPPLDTAPTVNLRSLGSVSGMRAEIDSEHSVNVFLGVPYAEHITRELRFEKPKPVRPWGQLNATVFPKSCYGHVNLDWLARLLGQSESADDCLYLNIFTPSDARMESRLLPVLVLIHGGAFAVGGSGMSYANYTDIGQNFVRHGIVVVTLQYRLGEYGFASTGDAHLPGNLGLWDQTEALKFVRRHIARFGGDPEQVTLLGQSAGSASISALGLSPHSRDLFHRAIQMSGSILSPWAAGSGVANETLLLANAFNCSTKDSLSIRRCLRNVEPAQMLAKVTEITAPRINRVPFHPRFDGANKGQRNGADFFPEDPLEMMADRAVPRKPTLQGFTQLEALTFTLLSNSNGSLTAAGLNWSDVPAWNEHRLRDYIRREVANTRRFGPISENVTAQIVDFYAQGDAGKRAARMGYNGSLFYVRQYTELVGDLLFAMPVMQEIGQKVAAGWPLYMYVNRHFNGAAFPPAEAGYPGIKETFHLHDLDFVFRHPDVDYSAFDEKDLQVQAFLRESYRNFIKTGNPSTASLDWPLVPSAQRLVHVQIAEGQATLARRNPFGEVNRRRFWDSITRKYPQYDMVRDLPGK